VTLLQVAGHVKEPVDAGILIARTSLNPTPNVTILWPPNHKLQDVIVYANAFDNGGGPITLSVDIKVKLKWFRRWIDITHCSQDDFSIESIDDATGVIDLKLRSGRFFFGGIRKYVIIVTATDAAGNQSTAKCRVLAPPNRRRFW